MPGSRAGRARRGAQVRCCVLVRQPAACGPRASLRVTGSTPALWAWSCAGVSAGDELDVAAITAGIPAGDKEAQQAALSTAAFEAATAEYVRMEAAITDPEQRRAMAEVFQQP